MELLSPILLAGLVWAGPEQGSPHPARLYGLADANWEYVADAPAGVDDRGKTIWDGGGTELEVPDVIVILKGNLFGRLGYFLNFTAPSSGSDGGEGVQLRNAWVEAPILEDRVVVRVGKLNRRLGLYSEILDVVPTFVGIQPPDLFSPSRVILTPTTNLMVHGAFSVSAAQLSYAVTAGNDERTEGALQLGADINVTVGEFKVGTALFASGGSTPTGQGDPAHGAVTWMAEDRYVAYGGYVELTPGNWVVQAEYWRADHHAVRDSESVTALADGDLNARQMLRFFNSGNPSNGITDPEIHYTVQTAYLRAGYQLPVGRQSSVTPYVQGDFYMNPEIFDATADDGAFLKYTMGAIVRPVPGIALTLDGGAHQLQYNDGTILYPEARISFSYLWQLDL